VEATVVDVSDRERAEARVLHLGRVSSVLSLVARAVLRTGDRGALLTEVCRIAVEDGGLEAAWFGTPSDTMPVARYGPEDGIFAVPAGSTRFVSEDRRRAAFPVSVKSGPGGVLGLYAAEAGFFDEQTVELLGGVADNLSIALEGGGRRGDEGCASSRADSRFRELLEAAPDAILECDAEGRILVVNAAAERLFGYSRAELLALRIENLVPERLRPVHSAHVSSFFTEPRSLVVAAPRKILARRKDGTEVPVEIGLSPVQAEQGGLVTCIVRDITARMQAEDALRESDRRVRSILESITDGFFAVDREWRLTYMNGRAERMVGRKREKLLGKRLWDEFPELAGSVLQQELQRAAETQRPMEFSAPYPPLKLWLDVHVYPSEGGLSVNFQDITIRKLLEEQSRQSQRLEALGRLAGEVAHDFNNLLTVIGGYSRIALESIDKSQGPLRRDVEIILEAATSASALTRQLLAFGRRQVVQARVLDLNRLITKMAKMLDHMIREDIELRMPLRAGLWRIKADPGQIEQVIMNLAVNARDAMPLGGTLSIVTDNREATGEPGITPPLAPGSYVLLAVSDTGAGLDEETRIRAVLHHQGQGQRHGVGPGHGLRDRQAERRGNLGGLGAGQGSAVRDLLPAGRQTAQRAEGGVWRSHGARGERNHPAGRR
jgi:PAS domain S-box-containing protein